MTDLDEAARRRAERLRDRRHDGGAAERVDRLMAQVEPEELHDLPDSGFPDLPEELRTDLEETRLKLFYGISQEYDVEPDAERHFWPLVLHLGLEHLKTMRISEVRNVLDEANPLEPLGIDDE